MAEFSCGDCGAKLNFSPGTTELECGHCGAVTPIEHDHIEVVENDYFEALREIESDAETQETRIVDCGSCGARYTHDENVASDRCPYCNSPQVRDGGSHKQLKPTFILPFEVTDEKARQRVRSWFERLGKRRLEPVDTKRKASVETLSGIYLPYWTFDCETTSHYWGEVGLLGFPREESYFTFENGQRVMKTREVRDVSWSPTRGTIKHTFDDVSVPASGTLSKEWAEAFEPWDLAKLVAFEEEYLAGFRAEVYQLDLKEAFETTKDTQLSPTITQLVHDDIRGDRSRIQTLNSSFESIRFKYILLPVWFGTYRHDGITYKFVVNGSNGEVQGERPLEKRPFFDGMWLIFIFIWAFALAIYFFGDHIFALILHLSTPL